MRQLGGAAAGSGVGSGTAHPAGVLREELGGPVGYQGGNGGFGG